MEEKSISEQKTNKNKSDNGYKLNLEHYDKFCLLTDEGIALCDENGNVISKKK